MALLETDFQGIPKRRGKVRDVYDLGDKLLMIATDRISAFDFVLPTPIPDKGRVLTCLTAHWLGILPVANHLISFDLDAAGLDFDPDVRRELMGRSMIVKKARVVPFECVVRGYLSGSGWQEYKSNGTVCGVSLSPGLVESSRLVPTVFTPATKAETGHDENVPFDVMSASIGDELAREIRRSSIEIYTQAAEYTDARGIILADTKFEWGMDDRTGELLLVDEVLTPDSSRYWAAEDYQPGGAQPSFDKQYVRDWLTQSGWDKASDPPELPDHVVARTRSKYIDAYEIITGSRFPWT